LLTNNASNNKEVTLTYILLYKKGLSNGQIHPMPFVAGMKTQDTNLDFQFTSADFDKDTSELRYTVLVSYDIYPLEFLSISFMVFDLLTPDIEIQPLYSIEMAENSQDVFVGVSKAKSKKPTLQASVGLLMNFE
jgi:hypothetical protein